MWCTIVKYSTSTTSTPSRFFIRRSSSAGIRPPRQAPSSASATMNTAVPHASDIAMNSGGSTAEPYACRATRNAKIVPVPVVSTKRQMNAATPAALL
jgi:hypothetical protein